MKILRTPDERFANLPDWPYEPRYVGLSDHDGGTLRMHYVDEGPSDQPAVVLLHGEPSWSFLYRKVIATLVERGLRAVAVDLVGFGRSDKPAEMSDHSYARHVEWVRAALFDQLGLRDVTIVGQDWGGLIGLRVVAENSDRVARLVAANTGLPTGDQKMADIWWMFHDAVVKAPVLDISRFVQSGCQTQLAPEVLAAYDAPFPDGSYQAGPKAMPDLVPTSPDDPAAEANRRAWDALSRFDKPVLMAFSDGDPITRGADKLMAQLIPGAQGQPHTTIEGGGHFLQEDKGEELGRVIADWMA